MPTRRGFFKSLAVAAGAAIVAPSIAETLAVNAKKYFFLSANPIADNIISELSTYTLAIDINHFYDCQIVRLTNIFPNEKRDGFWKVKSINGDMIEMNFIPELPILGLSRSMQVAGINNDAL